MEFPLSDASLAPGLAALITAQQAGARDVSVTNIRPLSGGNTRSAWSFDVAWVDGSGAHQEECVLLGRVAAGQLEVDAQREFDTLAALDGRALPVPRALWLDVSGEHLGMPGLVMTRAAGRTEIAALLRPESTASRSLAEQLVQVAAQLHSLDWQLLTPRPSTPAQPQEATGLLLQHWADQFARHRMEPVPALASVFGWLGRNLRAPDRLALVHGDLRFGNFLHEGGKLTALLDWELAHVGDPLEDLAWCYRPLWSPEQFLAWEEAVSLYEAATGSAVDRRRLAWWRIFSEAKFAVISLTAARNYMEGRTDNLRLAGRASKVPECLRLSLQWIGELEDAK